MQLTVHFLRTQIRLIFKQFDGKIGMSDMTPHEVISIVSEAELERKRPNPFKRIQRFTCDCSAQTVMQS